MAQPVWREGCGLALGDKIFSMRCFPNDFRVDTVESDQRARKSRAVLFPHVGSEPVCCLLIAFTTMATAVEYSAPAFMRCNVLPMTGFIWVVRGSSGTFLVSFSAAECGEAWPLPAVFRMDKHGEKWPVY